MSVDPSALARAIRVVPDFPQAGIQFQDITPLLGDPALLAQAVSLLAAPFSEAGITKVVAIESRGFILGAALAHRLGAGFVPMRKSGKLPYETQAASYDLEYGTDTIEMHQDALQSTDRVLIHDDVIATGGTAAAAAQLVQDNAQLFGFAFLLEIKALQGRGRLDQDTPVHSVLTV
ncbi:MAG: adenine phosphoribosyltransferase [Bacteroidota bacterium]